MSIKLQMGIATGQVPSAERLATAQNFLATLPVKTPDSNSGRYFVFDRNGDNVDPSYGRLKEELGLLNIRFTDSGSTRSSKARVIVEDSEVPKLESAIEAAKSRSLSAKPKSPSLTTAMA